MKEIDLNDVRTYLNKQESVDGFSIIERTMFYEVQIRFKDGTNGGYIVGMDSNKIIEFLEENVFKERMC